PHRPGAPRAGLPVLRHRWAGPHPVPAYRDPGARGAVLPRGHRAGGRGGALGAEDHRDGPGRGGPGAGGRRVGWERGGPAALQDDRLGAPLPARRRRTLMRPLSFLALGLLVLPSARADVARRRSPVTDVVQKVGPAVVFIGTEQ